MTKEHHKDKTISKTMMIGDAVSEYPDIVPIMIENGMHCIGCGASMFETLEEGFLGHGMSDKEIDKIMGEINKLVKDNPKK
jgi:hydroxylamine reductase